MFLIVNAKGQFWDGLGWNQRGRDFLTVAQATRSLHEEGEGLENKIVISSELYSRDPE